MRIGYFPALILCTLLGAFAVGYLAIVDHTSTPVPESQIAGLDQMASEPKPDAPWLREVSIHIDMPTGRPGFPKPGDFVDILLVQKVEQQVRGRLLMQAIRIVNIDQPDNAGRSPQTPDLAVTVEVDRYQAQRLAVAQQIGTLSVTPHVVVLEDQAPNPVEQQLYREPFRDDETPLIPGSDLTPPPGGGINL